MQPRRPGDIGHLDASLRAAAGRAAGRLHDAPGPPEVTPATTLVGRDAELDRIASWVADTVAGRGHAVLFEGEPGVGKSALLAELATAATAAGAATLTGRAREPGWATSLAAACDVVGAHREGADPVLARVARLAAPDAVADPRRAMSHDDQAAALEQLLGWVDAQVAGGPVALLLDDGQWADDVSVEAWRRLCRTAESGPLLLVAAWRPSPRSPAAAALRQAVLRGGDVVAVRPLSASATGELVRHAVGGATPGPRLRAAVDVAAGNPQRVLDVLAGAAGELSRDGGVVDIPEESVPPGGAAGGALRSLAAVSADAREVAVSAALLGTDIVPAELAAVLDRPATALLGPLDELIDAGLVVDHPPVLRFQHDLVRDALVETVPPGQRRAAHETAALALAHSGAAVDRVAEHVLRGPERVDPALVDWVLGVSTNLVTRASPLAVDLLARVRGSLDPEEPRLPVADLLVGAALMRSGRLADAAAHLRPLTGPETLPVLAVEARRLLSYALLGLGRSPEAAAELASVLDDPSLPPEQSASFRSLLSQAHFTAGDFAAAAAAATVVCDELPETDPVASSAVATLALVDLVTGEQQRAEGRLQRALDALPQVAGDVYDDPRQHLLHALGWVRIALDDLDGAAAAFTEGRRVAEVSGGYYLQPLIIGGGFVAYQAGRWDELLGDVEEGLAGPEGASTGTGRPLLALAALVAVHRESGDAAAAIGRLEDQLQLRSDLATVAWEMCRALARAAWHEAQGQPGEALDVLEAWLTGGPSAGEVRQLGRALLGSQAVRLAVATGRAEVADRLVSELADDAAGQPTPLRSAASAYARALATGDAPGIASAAAAYRQAGCPVAAARADEEAAVLLARAGSLDPARTAARRAGQVYVELGAVTDRRRLADRLREHGVTRLRLAASHSATGEGSLSATELAVAERVAAGLSNPEVAAELRMSRRQVQGHVSRVLRKLGLASRVELGRALAGPPQPGAPAGGDPTG